MLEPTPSTTQAAPEPLGADVPSHWVLDPAVTFLNHGCFGAVPREVLEAQTAWRQRLEARPVELLDRRRRELIDKAKQAVGRFLAAEPRDFGFVTNATGGVNAVLRSLRFEPGDELLTTNHVYNAVRMAMRYVAERSGAQYREIEIPLPVGGPGEIVDAVASALTDRTKLLVIDHIASPTAIVFPVKRLLELCAGRGVDVLIDGAHAPGQLALDVEELGAAYYTGNLHKWVCAPKGAAFLWVRPDRQAGIHPTTISHFLGEGLAEEFQWQATRDITAWLCAPDAIAFMDRHFGWERLRRHNHEMAVWVQALLAGRWGVEASSPPDGSMLAAMATIAVPDALGARFETVEAAGAALYDGYGIEVPVIDWNDRWWIRASCQVYNEPVQYERLAEAVLELAGN